MLKSTVRQRSIGFVSVPLSIFLLLFQWWAEVKEMITEANADILLWIAIGILGVGVVYVFLPYLRRVRITIQTDSPKATNWLTQVLFSDREHLADRIQLQPPIGWEYYLDSEPCIIALATYINNAIFPIRIKGIEGSFQIGRTKCNLTATIDREHSFPRLHRETIKIRQGISKDTASIIAVYREKEQELLLDPRECFLIVESEEPDYKSRPIRVPIGTQFIDKRIKIVKG